jgi:hypothetical protein
MTISKTRTVWAFLALASALGMGCSKKSAPPSSESTGQETSPIAAPETTSSAHAAAGPGVCSAHIAAPPPRVEPVTRTCTATEELAWSKDSTGACLDCLFEKGCINDRQTQGQECADLPGGPGSPQEHLCLDTLACDLGIRPQAKPAPSRGLTIAAYCARDQSAQACIASPRGPCAAQWNAGFAGQNPQQILSSAAARTTPGGMANAIAGCANYNCTMCL